MEQSGNALEEMVRHLTNIQFVLVYIIRKELLNVPVNILIFYVAKWEEY